MFGQGAGPAYKKGDARIVSKEYTDLNGYTTADAFNVTGDVAVKVFGVVGDTPLTSENNAAKLSVGTADASTAMMGDSTVNGAANFQAGDVWCDSSPNKNCEEMLKPDWFIIGGGANIQLAKTTVNGMTGGKLTLYCWWRPLSQDGRVVAA